MRAEMGGGGPPREVSNKVQPTEGARPPGGKTLGGDVPQAGIADHTRALHGKYTPREPRVRSTGETTIVVPPKQNRESTALSNEKREPNPEAVMPEPRLVRELDRQGRDGWKAWAESVQPGLEEKVRAAGITEDDKVGEVLANAWSSFPSTLRDAGRSSELDVTEFMTAHTEAHVASVRTGEPFDRNAVVERFVTRTEDVEISPQEQTPKEPAKKSQPLITGPLDPELIAKISSEYYRKILTLKDIDGLTNTEVATALETDTQTLSRALTKARHAYRQEAGLEPRPPQRTGLLITGPLDPEVLARVDENYRNILRLKETDGLTNTEIANKLGLATKTVENKFATARHLYLQEAGLEEKPEDPR